MMTGFSHPGPGSSLFCLALLDGLSSELTHLSAKKVTQCSLMYRKRIGPLALMLSQNSPAASVVPPLPIATTSSYATFAILDSDNNFESRPEVHNDKSF